MHELQKVFASEAGEIAWTKDMHALFGAGAFDEAEALLAEALTALDTELSWTCLELPRDAVALTGWEELGEAIEMHEGEQVSGVTIAIANEGDRDFEKGRAHHPHVLLGIYTDEAYPFSGTVHSELLDECHADMPAWAGREEDIEVHMDIDGLDLLNTKLAHHKQRHFFRDEVDGVRPLAAPRLYVEFVLACWWRALRWHQAVADQCARCGLPRAIPVIAGMVDMRPAAMAIHVSATGAARAGMPLARHASANLTETFGDAFIQRRQVQEERAPPSVSELRRRAQNDDEAREKPARAGFLTRIFRRR